MQTTTSMEVHRFHYFQIWFEIDFIIYYDWIGFFVAEIDVLSTRFIKLPFYSKCINV